jgi:hypothetical protein
MPWSPPFNQQNVGLRSGMSYPLEQAVEREVPTFREINRDPRWLQWLTGRHEYSGFTRQRLLDDSIQTGNAHRVISLFRSFQQAVSAGRATTDPPAVGQRGPYGRNIYARADITNMHKLRMQGRINDADWMRWEHEMIAAGREGRIIGTLDIDGVPRSR